MIWEMKIADYDFFVDAFLLWKQGCHQKRLVREQSSVSKIRWAG